MVLPHWWAHHLDGLPHGSDYIIETTLLTCQVVDPCGSTIEKVSAAQAMVPSILQVSVESAWFLPLACPVFSPLHWVPTVLCIGVQNLGWWHVAAWHWKCPELSLSKDLFLDRHLENKYWQVALNSSTCQDITIQWTSTWIVIWEPWLDGKNGNIGRQDVNLELLHPIVFWSAWSKPTSHFLRICEWVQNENQSPCYAISLSIKVFKIRSWSYCYQCLLNWSL